MNEGEYIRFGEIPTDGKSKIYNGDILVGKEKGVSVYKCIAVGNEYKIIMPHLKYSTCVTLSGCLDRQAYLVSGNVVGVGSDGEPLLESIQIIKKLKLKNHALQP